MEIIETLAAKLMQKRGLYRIISIPTAKVPIVKFTDRDLRLEGDISLYNTLVSSCTIIPLHILFAVHANTHTHTINLG